MIAHKNLRFFGCVIFFLSCQHISAPLIPKDLTNENEKKNTLFVFVGEKIEVRDLPYKSGDFDLGFTAKYKILQRVYGKYDKNIIEFEAYDHYGKPDFARYEDVLMFVSEENGKYYMEKYMFNDVYKTKNGRWAGGYSIEDYGHIYNTKTTVKPEKIDFVKEVSYPTTIINYSGKNIHLSYPAPYYKTVGDRAFVVYGNFVEDLFRLKKNGVLTARKLFGNRSADDDIQNVISPKEPRKK